MLRSTTAMLSKIQDFEFLVKIHNGLFGEIHLCREWSSGELCVLKQFKKDLIEKH